MEREQLVRRLAVDWATLRTFCGEWKVAELALFGSILGRGFGPDSDVDALVTFEADARWTLWDFIRMRDEFAQLLGREVDLIERSAIARSRNYIRREAILGSSQVIYAA